MRVRRVAAAFPRVSGGDIVIASGDGNLVYQFDRDGRHLRTVHALTGATVYEFGYDAKKRLVQVTDGDGNVTTTERDGNGTPTGIVSPFGQRTTLAVNPQGYLATVTGPGGVSNNFDYTDDGLLTGVTTPRGDRFTFAYDSLGRIIEAEGPESDSLTLERAETANGHQVRVTTALGRVSSYLVEQLSTGAVHRLETYPDNTRTDIVIGTDGTRTTILRDGTVLTEVEGPDPRFGMQAPILKSVTTKTPSGLTTKLTGNRTVVLSDPDDLLSLTGLADTVTLSAKTTTKAFDAATRTFTTTSPRGRTTYGNIDTQGRTVRVRQPGFEALRLAYDDRGRPSSQSMGSGANARTFTLGYNDAGQIDSVTDPLSRVTRFAYDSSWQLISHTFPNGRIARFEHDANGFVTGLTPPGRPTHRFVYTSDNAMKTYAPPQVGGSNKTQYAYDEDGQPTLITLPDGQTIGFGYDSSGRLATITLPSGVLHFEYDPAKGDLTRITSPDGSTVSFAYDGFLPVEETWTGVIAGSVEHTFNDELRVASESVNGGHGVAYAYDDDGLLTQSGDLVLNWHSQSAVLVGTALGKITDSWTYNAFGEPESYSASFNGGNIYSYVLSYGKLGRVLQRNETIEGVTTTFAYSYDMVGRLTEVRKNGEVVASYGYDANGNRLTQTDGSGTVSGTYDAQDRLLQYGPTEYTHTLNGELSTKVTNAQTTTYTYDVEGNLRTVILPDGRSLEYLIDGRNRRVGKKVNGTLMQGFLYQTPLNVVAELDSSNVVVRRFVYGSRGNVPDYMVKGGATYRILSDHLGSPRLMVNVADGSVAQRMDYDEFGNVVLDTNPGFQPFGFAGGLYDPDTGLFRFGARDYDSHTGRWTTKDPIRFAGGDLNLYAYVFNNPVSLVDPEGLQPHWVARLAVLYDAQGRKEEATELRRIDKAYGAFGRSEYKRHGYFKRQPACHETASQLMKNLPQTANMQRFRFVRVGAGKQAPGAYSHTAAGLVDVKTNTLVAVLDPIVIGPLPGMQFMRRNFSQQYNPLLWETLRGFNYDPLGVSVGIDTVQTGK
jgi:RHS repeat-associated protein